MARIFEHWRTLVATLFSVVLIVGMYIFARSGGVVPIAQASVESALLQAIATKDSDDDGLPDWEEALYGTDSHVSDTFRLGMTDGEAVARGLIVPKAIADIPTSVSTADPSDSEDTPEENTLTVAFAKSFFSLYLVAKQANGGDLSEQEMQKVASDALQSLASSIKPAPDFKSEKDLTISGSGTEALKTFAISAEAVLLKRSSNASKNETLYLQDAVEKNDTTALSFIATIAKSYRESAIGLSMLPIPSELKEVNLVLINTLMRMSNITDDFTRVNEDPLTTILAVQQYPQIAIMLGKAFVQIGQIYTDAGIEIPAGTPGASFVNMIKDIVAAKQADQKP